MEMVQFVIYNKLLFWMEMISIWERAHEAIVILKKIIEWPELKVCCLIVYHGIYLMLASRTLDPNNELTIFIHDTFHFVLAFITPISESASYIYLSALLFVLTYHSKFQFMVSKHTNSD